MSKCVQCILHSNIVHVQWYMYMLVCIKEYIYVCLRKKYRGGNIVGFDQGTLELSSIG